MLKKIPNILTIGRILIVPFFVLAFYLPGFYGDLTALILFIVASFTDFLDGMLARLLGEESKLGELLDPIADKIIVATALILLVMDGTIRNYEVIAAIIILAAIGSKSSPNLDSSPSNLANIPSKKSVKEATINNIKAVKSP